MSNHSARTAVISETTRLETFSDGVFAIAMTLLILEIRVPTTQELVDYESLANALLQKWPSFLSFFISFGTILVMWVNHHKLFTLIKRTDHWFMFINGLLLMFVTFTPFPTALLAEHLNQSDAITATLFLSGTYFVLSLCFNGLWLYAAHNRRLIDHGCDHEMVRSITRRYSFGPPLYLSAFVLSYFNATISIVIILSLAVFFAFTGSKTYSPRG